MPSRKHSRSGFDYATPAVYYPTAPSSQYPPTGGYPIYGYNAASGYPHYGYGGPYNSAYGAEGYHHYMRSYDPNYDAYFPEGPTVEDKWRNTYPYVPTSYTHTSSEGRNTGSRRRQGNQESGHSLPREAGSRPTSNLKFAADELEEQTDEDRDHWGSQWEFIFSCIGLSVGIGNVWRFPYLAFVNGGAAFLLPYFILLLIVGKPMYFMEVALGQFSQLGPFSVWRMTPIARGVGFAMCTLSLIVAIYYNVVMGYCLHYMYFSFSWTLPWDTCDKDWADKATCYIPTDANSSCSASNSDQRCQPASEQYWERFVLGLHNAPLMTYTESYNSTSDELVDRTYALSEFGNIGIIKWDLLLALFISWTVVFLCLSKGIKSSGKVVYFTATFPYLILLILLVRGLMLEGALEGIKFFFIPDWKKLLDISVWRLAAEQMFFSLSVSWGGLIMFGSYNKFRTKVHYHAFIISSLDFVTSIIASIVIFSILGALKVKLGLDDIQDVVKQKQGLAFVVYPQAVSLMPIPQLWAVLFFFMLFTLGLDSEFALLETILTAIYDTFPITRRHKAKTCLIACIASFLLSIPCVSLSGQFIFDLMDTYGGGLGVLWVAIFETIAIMWIYGVQRFSEDLQFMLNIKISILIKICWAITPLILAGIFAIACWHWTPPTFQYQAGVLHYSDWAHGVGWFLTLIVALQIPIVALIMTIMYATRGKTKELVRPINVWGPGDLSEIDEWHAFQYKKSFQCKQHPQGMGGPYDNYGMQYPYPYTYNYGGGNYHM
ncbi:hypothetical protein TCAL_10129 [Tigriopus californicus]|uniref:Transporter n=1 Tax=Tigriopus californicus TaxID=6832 RepID=A0A553P4F2_TIGCA|nr:sodium- and chloride-dependent neutral and basic amino acid transporter B(0+)-like isoform X1 [Tigriopus californicus]TRY72568.1 hypothetical protein TCAL_10129 [Tigriopus californicus]